MLPVLKELYCHHSQLPWKCIWRNNAPLEVECFTGLVAHECLTQDNLRRRGKIICSRCALCERHNEDANHIFIQCAFTGQIWDFVLNNRQG
uniref:Putative ovule protein n=1 Tax=Solanum chacoense TaxID=4108 RepID=A0A0V0H788_SOLCH